MTKWEASITVTCYTYASHPFLQPHQLISSFFFFFIPIFAQLFGGLSELHFLQTLYAQKALDVWFPTVIASLDLELRSSRYSARKEGDAELKNSEMFFLEKFISSNPKQISLNPFDEN